MLKVHILLPCETCQGQAYMPNGEGEDYKGRKYTRFAPCPTCDGSGNQPKWVDLSAFLEMLKQAQCKHEHTSYQGGMHFSAGDVWDDIQEVCIDCGANLERQTLGDFIQDDN